MTVVFVGVIITILAVMFVTNSNFLEQYYVVYKMEDLTNMYKAAEEKVKDGSLGEDDANEALNHLSEKSNISAIIADEDGSILFMTAREKNGQLFAQLMGYLIGENQDEGKLLKHRKNYELRQDHRSIQ